MSIREFTQITAQFAIHAQNINNFLPYKPTNTQINEEQAFNSCHHLASLLLPENHSPLSGFAETHLLETFAGLLHFAFTPLKSDLYKSKSKALFHQLIDL